MRITALILILAILAGCNREVKDERHLLMATDSAFSRMSSEKGLNAAFIEYAHDSVLKMRDGNFPIVGKKTMDSIYRSRPDTGMVLTWYPVRAEVASSGELGYTFGNWELFMRSQDTTLYGNYLSIWKKDSDGRWKYILDTGCNTPKPVKTR